MKQNLIAEITAVLQQASLVRNLAWQKIIAYLVIILIKSRNVQLSEVAQHLNDVVKPTSNETKIQDFFRQVNLDYFALAYLLVSFLLGHGKLRLCLDRKEWDFGHLQVNILLATIGQGNFQVPLYWELLDNRSSNSNSAQRTAILQVYVAVLNCERIRLVLGNQECVGYDWFMWLKDSELNFIMRLHLLTNAYGQCQAIANLDLAEGQVRRLVWGQVRVKALAGNEFFIFFSTAGLPDLTQLCARCWTIEQCFLNLKGRSFQLGNIHLYCHHKPLALVTLAYASA